MDINIKRRNNFVNNAARMVTHNGETFPLMSVFEVNSCGLCNRFCSFCPRGKEGLFPNVNEFLSLSLWEKVLNDLAGVQYTGLFLISAFSEPLLHPEITTIIQLAKTKCAGSRVELVTNGDFLSVERLHTLFASGLDAILVSMYDGPEQKDHFDGLRLKSGIREDQMVLRKRYDMSEFNCTNRGGLLHGEGQKLAQVLPLARDCYLPCYTLLMDYDGTVYICTHDWGKKLNVGNIATQHVMDVWNGEALNRARVNVLSKNRCVLPCRDCDADGILVGNEHARLWQSYLAKQQKDVYYGKEQNGSV